MDYIEFDTHLSNEGTIIVPDKYRSELSRKKLLHVKVITGTAPNTMGNPQTRRLDDSDTKKSALEIGKIDANVIPAQK